MVLLRTTVGSPGEARAMAKRLVGDACCVHVQRIESFYTWDGQLEEAEEWLVEARTPLEHQDAVWDAMLEGHPYDTPLVEVVAKTLVPARYAAWAKRVTG